MRDDKLSTKSGIVNLHPTKGTHWVKFYFDSFGCPLPVNIMKQIKKCYQNTKKISNSEK